jgi:hypothetical protein
MVEISTLFLKKNDFILAFGLLIAVLCTYQPAWNGQPVWDDDVHMTKPSLVTSLQRN